MAKGNYPLGVPSILVSRIRDLVRADEHPGQPLDHTVLLADPTSFDIGPHFFTKADYKKVRIIFVRETTP